MTAAETVRSLTVGTIASLGDIAVTPGPATATEEVRTMPEYLTPGVYVEETSFRSRSIEGVPTSTFGMTGVTEYGPVPYTGNNATMVHRAGPVLVTSFAEYERAFGGLTIAGQPCQVALAARAFFANGGRRLYVARVFPFTMTRDDPPTLDVQADFAVLDVPAQGTPLLRWKARWPGSVASQIRVSVTFRRSTNTLVPTSVGAELRGLRPGAAVEVVQLDTAGQPPATDDDIPPVAADVKLVTRRDDGTYGYVGNDGAFEAVAPQTAAFHITLDVTVAKGDERVDVYDGLELGQDHPRSAFEVLQADDPADGSSLVWLDRADPGTGARPTPGQLLEALLDAGEPGAFLAGGGDGSGSSAALLLGQEADPDVDTHPAHGLAALAEVEEIAVVATPDTVDLTPGEQQLAVDNLIGHCERLRYRMAIIDPPRDSSMSDVRRFRSNFDSTYAALYYPWLRIVDPTRTPDPRMPPPLLDVPPSGAIAGVYARSDLDRGVHKAPANEPILGIMDFTTNVTSDLQSVLNPEGINALRFFPGRGSRVWGARLMSSDPEWKYVSVRRLFIYLEHSIDKSTQWAVFEPNNERLWSSIRQTIEDFLLSVWTTGALMGDKPEEAFFVRCDRSTMTQNDLDDGRLVCLVGVAPTHPAEFVIFRIGQWTAGA